MSTRPNSVAGVAGGPPVDGGAGKDSYRRLEVARSPDYVVSRLRRAISRRGAIEYAIVDHERDMAEAGVEGLCAWSLVFGNPEVGARVLAKDLRAAVDIPLRMAVIGSGDGAEIIYRDMRDLLPDNLAGIAADLTSILEALASEVAVVDAWDGDPCKCPTGRRASRLPNTDMRHPS